MNIGVCYAEAERQLWMKIDVPDGTSIRDAIERSGLLNRFPEIDLGKQKVGIFGKLVKLDGKVQDGDRIEIYRPITADPKTVKRRRIKTEEDD
jgi:putative ubiquitin-RnfH superfamily antitoxin RatB of RatAB toxin-antitoxin module